ncbi:MAG: biotin synthase BioB [Myxococcota bacterium]|nr:biotin synthase BioB [Myxococcota bacterium]
MDWELLTNQVLEGHQVTRDEALQILRTPDDELLSMLHSCFRIRRRHHGRRVRVHVLQNAKSGACPEDCAFCSQSVRYKADVNRYKTQTVDELVAGARAAYASGAVTYCMVTATRDPSSSDLEVMVQAVRQIKEEMPLKLCTSLGLLTEDSAQALADAGVDRYNHNLESSRGFFPELCTTHTWEDRHDTLRHAKASGMEACAGGIVGMGESEEDRVDLALALRDLGVESVPVNLLNPRPGTPLGHVNQLSAQDALKALAMFRYVHPDRDVRIAGGREVVLGTMQPLALYVANSIFSNGYLTTGGQGESEDAKMLAEAGFEIEVVEEAPPAQASA